MPFILQSFIRNYKALPQSLILLNPENNPEVGINIPSYKSEKESESEYSVVVQ